MNLNPGRQSFQNLKLVRVFVTFRNEPRAELDCKCGNRFSIALSKWRNSPPFTCVKCAIKKNRIIGPGLQRKLAGLR